MLGFVISSELAHEDVERMNDYFKLLLDAGSDVSSICIMTKIDIPVSAFSSSLDAGTLVRRSHHYSCSAKQPIMI